MTKSLEKRSLHNFRNGTNRCGSMAFQERHPNVVTPEPPTPIPKKPMTQAKENVPPKTGAMTTEGLDESFAAFNIFEDEVSPVLTTFKPTSKESLPPASPGNLSTYRYDKKWWQRQKDSISEVSRPVVLDVLRNDDGTPKRRTLSELQETMVKQRGFLSNPTPRKPSYRQAVLANTRETPVRMPSLDILKQATKACQQVANGRSVYVASVERAEGLLRQAVKASKGNRDFVDGSSYNNLIHAYAECLEPEKAESIINLMWTDYKAGNEAAKPNVRVYTSVLFAWQKSKKPDAPLRCEHIVDQMQRFADCGLSEDCEPDLFSYTCCLHTWADSKSEDAPERAMAIFTKINERFLQGDLNMQPDSVCYANLMNAFAKSSTEWRRAEDILFEMIQDYLDGNEKAKPQVRAINTVLSLWAKATDDDATEQAESLLRRIHELNAFHGLDVYPDSYSYALLLKAWAHSKHPNGALEAEEALYWMEDIYKKGGNDGARLDVVKYATVIGALARGGHPGNAELLLRKMCDEFQGGGNDKVKPELKFFHQVLASWSHYSNPQVAAARAYNIIGLMWALGEDSIKPDYRAYNSVLFCWKSAGKPSQAEACLREMQRYGVTPTHVSFEAVVTTWKQSGLPNADAKVQQLEKESIHFGRRRPRQGVW